MRAVCTTLLAVLLFISCEVKKPAAKPEPHLELGQLITFLGCDPDRSYIIIGYKDQLEAVTEKVYRNQDYIVFLYINDFHDVKEAAIHRNSIIKNRIIFNES